MTFNMGLGLVGDMYCYTILTDCCLFSYSGYGQSTDASAYGQQQGVYGQTVRDTA